MATRTTFSMELSNQNNQSTTSYWNRECSKPVTCRLAIFPTWTQCEVLHSARRTLCDSAQSLKKQQLEGEYFVLNRMLYMKHGQLRRDKALQGLKQIRTCLKKIFALGLERSVKEMNSHFEDAVVQEGIRVYLPSRQMWEHLLTLFLGAAALLRTTASRCANVFLHVHKHLSAGMLIPTNLLFLAMLSRIWACCQGLCLELQSWYAILKPVAGVLQPTQVAWLPEGEDLPGDLSVWLTQQGFSSGLDHHNGEDDRLVSLMAMYQDGEEKVETATETEPPVDGTLTCMAEEDMGDPVDIGEVAVRRGDILPSLPEDADQSLAVRGKTGLKEKITAASSIRDLLRILRKFQKKFPESSSKKKTQKCCALLADLQARWEALGMKAEATGGQKLLAVGRKTLIKLFRSMSSTLHSAPAARLSHGQPPSLAKRRKEKNAGQRKQVAVPVNSKPDSFRVKKTDKDHCAGGAKSLKKGKKNSRTVDGQTERNRKLNPASAGRKENLEYRKRKKNDPVNNQMKATQVKQKKKKGRKN
ncbi:uncharacterized protein LOC143295950 isoform X2 [Babylonia areolata]|uniref:uncharacterized protein LOC143295950 isoform X2 n=1 Tax=Babylonia areolata TaxID=304850 RepID=UPI003FD51857